MSFLYFSVLILFLLLLSTNPNYFIIGQTVVTNDNITTISSSSSPAPLPPSPTFPSSIQFSRNTALDITLYVGAALALISPHVPIAAFIISRTAAVSRTITPLAILEQNPLNSTVSCASYGYRTSKYDGSYDAPLFFDAPIMGWSFARAIPINTDVATTTPSPGGRPTTPVPAFEMTSDLTEPFCYGPLLANLVGNLIIGLGVPLLVYFVNFVMLTVKFRALPSSFLEPAANGWTSRVLVVLFFGFLFPGSVASSLLSAAKCAHGFSGAIAGAVIFLSCVWLYSVLFWRRRSEVFRFRKLTFKSAKNLSKLQLWIIYFCEPRGIWKWIHDDTKAQGGIKKNNNNNAKEVEQLKKGGQPQLSTSLPAFASMKLDNSKKNPNNHKKITIGAGGSTHAATVNSHPTLTIFHQKNETGDTVTKNIDEEDDDEKKNAVPSSQPVVSLLHQLENNDDEDEDERSAISKRKGKMNDESAAVAPPVQSAVVASNKVEKLKKGETSKDEKTKKADVPSDESEDEEEDEDKNPKKHEALSQMRYLIALPFFDLYAGKTDYAFILVEIVVRVLMIVGLVIADTVPQEVSCVTLRAIYMFSSILLCVAAFARSPYSNHLAFYAIVISSGCEVMVEALLIVDPFSGAEYGPPILMASVIISVILLCFSNQLYFWIAPVVWDKLHFLEYEVDPAQPLPPTPPRSNPNKQQGQSANKNNNGDDDDKNKKAKPLEMKEEANNDVNSKCRQSQNKNNIDYDELLGTMPVRNFNQQQQQQKDHDSDLDSLDVPLVVNQNLAQPNSNVNANVAPSQKRMEVISSSDDDDDPLAVGSSIGAATTVTSYAFHHLPKKEETFDLFERLDRQVRKAFFDLFHEDVHVLPRHQQLVDAQESFEQLIDL